MFFVWQLVCSLLKSRSKIKVHTLHLIDLHLFFLRFYLFIHERHRKRGRGRRSRRSPMWDSIPGIRDQALSQRQMLNHWATQAFLIDLHLKYLLTYKFSPFFFSLFVEGTGSLVPWSFVHHWFCWLQNHLFPVFFVSWFLVVDEA